MTPWQLFLYTIAVVGGLTLGAIALGILRFAWMVLIGWVMGAPKQKGAEGANE